jgi:hypothetical protein
MVENMDFVVRTQAEFSVKKTWPMKFIVVME